MTRKVLTLAEYSLGEAADGISTCINILQEAADYILTVPNLQSGVFIIRTSEGQPDHRVIIGDPAALLIERPYVVGFYGIRSPDPDGAVTKDLLGVDNKLIESLVEFGVGLYNTARLQGEFVNTALLRDKKASSKWAAENTLHQAAVDNLAPKCYTKVLKFTGYVDNWPEDCRIAIDEVILID
jgi:hypothetical protein